MFSVLTGDQAGYRAYCTKGTKGTVLGVEQEIGGITGAFDTRVHASVLLLTVLPSSILCKN